MSRLTVALLLFLAATPAAAQRTLGVERFDAAIAVNLDGSVDVTETITAKFIGSWNGIYRTVPVEYHTPQGFNWTLHLELLGATGADGQTLKVEKERERHYVKYKIWVPGAQDATRTVRPALPGEERAPVLRGSRRAVLERDRRRVGRARRQRLGADHAAAGATGRACDRLQRGLRLDGAGCGGDDRGHGGAA